MSLVVMLRGVNVGGHKTFKPSEFVKKLAGFDAINIGAAGTFVVHGRVGAKSLRSEIALQLPYETKVMICTAEEIIALVQANPFGEKPPAKEVKWFATAFEKPLQQIPSLPIDFPPTTDWKVRIVHATGRFALSLCRRGEGTLVYPNEVCEKTFGLPATTRGWPTILSVCKALTQD